MTFQGMEFVEASGVKDGSRIFRVRFECGYCGRLIEEVLPEDAGRTLKRIAQIDAQTPTAGDIQVSSSQKIAQMRLRS